MISPRSVPRAGSSQEHSGDEESRKRVPEPPVDSGIGTPRRIPGQGKVLFSPTRLFALTRVVRDDIDVDDIDLWLTEEPLETVHKNGIMVGHEWFVADELLRYTTGDKGGPRPDLVIRYDRSRLARGLLEEVRVFERTATGYDLVCVAIRREQFLATIKRDRFLRARNAHLKGLLARRSTFENDYVALQAGLQAQEDLLQKIEARRRFQSSTRPRPRIATPIDGMDESEEAKRNALGVALKNADAKPRDATTAPPQASPQAQTRESFRNPTPTGEAKTRRAPQGQSVTPPAALPPPGSSAPPESRSTRLGRALGGSNGFQTT